jgi:hypothetical protein
MTTSEQKGNTMEYHEAAHFVQRLEAVAGQLENGVAAWLEAQGMIAENQFRTVNGYGIAYSEESFKALRKRYCGR